MNATKARGVINAVLLSPDKGVLVRGKKKCDHCFGRCVYGTFRGIEEAGYTYYDEIICKDCAVKMRLIP